MTVHAPHCPRPHPNFAPLRPRLLRSTYSSGVSGSTSISCVVPLTLQRHHDVTLSLGRAGADKLPSDGYIGSVSALARCFATSVGQAGPSRLVRESRAHVVQQIDDLRIRDHCPVRGHDGTALSGRWWQAMKYDVDDVGGVGRMHGAAQAQVDAAERQGPTAIMTTGARWHRRVIGRARLNSRQRLALLHLRLRCVTPCDRRHRRAMARTSLSGDVAKVSGHRRHRPAGDAMLGMPAVAQIEVQAVDRPGHGSWRPLIDRIRDPPFHLSAIKMLGCAALRQWLLRGVWHAPQ